LYEETSLRDKIALHPQSYYKTVFEKSSAYPGITLTLYLAEHESDVLAGIIVLRNGRQAVYLYGASSNIKRDLMPAYGLQWRAIKDSLQAGCSEYDFFGIPPDDNPAHPMHGLYRFKTGFGGRIEHREGCWDWAASSIFYGLYRRAESLRQWYFKVFRKR
jgi:lipid II:glycine glycyltransferase (peptidoglycan interpeptide bridge formation enzyme)